MDGLERFLNKKASHDKFALVLVVPTQPGGVEPDDTHTVLVLVNPERVVEEGLLDPHALVQVGIRGPLSSVEHEEISKRLGARVLTIDACFVMGVPAVVQTIHQVVRDRR